jgi:hypothetical protein
MASNKQRETVVQKVQQGPPKIMTGSPHFLANKFCFWARWSNQIRKSKMSGLLTKSRVLKPFFWNSAFVLLQRPLHKKASALLFIISCGFCCCIRQLYNRGYTFEAFWRIRTIYLFIRKNCLFHKTQKRPNINRINTTTTNSTSPVIYHSSLPRGF